MTDKLHPAALIDRARTLYGNCDLLESNAKEKLDYFLKGLLAFSKRELYDLLCQYSKLSHVKIEIPFTSEVQLVKWAGTKKMSFWEPRCAGFLGDEYIKSDQMFDSFANDKRKGRRFVFVEPSGNPIARKACIDNILQLIKEENQNLYVAENYLKEYDDRFLGLISEAKIGWSMTTSHFIHNLKKEKENEITRNN